MHDTHDTVRALGTGNRYDDEMRDLTHQIWLLKADRSPTRTHRLLTLECQDRARAVEEEFGVDFDDESLNIPSIRQVNRWIKDGKWEETAADDIARMAPRLYKDFNARLFAQVDAAQRFDGDVLDGRYDDFKSPGVLAIKEKVAARVQQLAGVGMSGVQQTVTLPQPSVKQVEDNLSPVEMGARMHEKLMEFRERR